MERDILHTEEGGVQRSFSSLSRHSMDGLNKEEKNKNSGIDRNNEDRTTTIQYKEIFGNIEDNKGGKSPEAGDTNLTTGPVRVTPEGRNDTGGHILNSGLTTRSPGERAMGSKRLSLLIGVGAGATLSFSREVELGGSPRLE